MKDKRFEELREGIYQELLKANQHFKICWSIHLASKDIARATRVHLAFFYYTMWSNNDRFCLAIYNIIKPDDDTANFTRLFNYIRSNRNLSKIFVQREINEMEKTIQSHKNLIDRIKVIRDQYVAHNQLNKKHLDGETTYTHKEGKELLKDLERIFNELSRKYDQNLWSFDTSPRLDVKAVLRNLTEHYNDRTRRIRAGKPKEQT